MPSSVDLPPPAIAKMPTRWPSPTVSAASIARTPVGSGWSTPLRCSGDGASRAAACGAARGRPRAGGRPAAAEGIDHAAEQRRDRRAPAPRRPAPAPRRRRRRPAAGRTAPGSLPRRRSRSPRRAARSAPSSGVAASKTRHCWPMRARSPVARRIVPPACTTRPCSTTVRVACSARSRRSVSRWLGARSSARSGDRPRRRPGAQLRFERGVDAAEVRFRCGSCRARRPGRRAVRRRRAGAPSSLTCRAIAASRSRTASARDRDGPPASRLPPAACRVAAVSASASRRSSSAKLADQLAHHLQRERGHLAAQLARAPGRAARARARPASRRRRRAQRAGLRSRPCAWPRARASACARRLRWACSVVQRLEAVAQRLRVGQQRHLGRAQHQARRRDARCRRRVATAGSSCARSPVSARPACDRRERAVASRDQRLRQRREPSSRRWPAPVRRSARRSGPVLAARRAAPRRRRCSIGATCSALSMRGHGATLRGSDLASGSAQQRLQERRAERGACRAEARRRRSTGAAIGAHNIAPTWRCERRSSASAAPARRARRRACPSRARRHACRGAAAQTLRDHCAQLALGAADRRWRRHGRTARRPRAARAVTG